MILASIASAVGNWLRHFHGPLAYVLCGLLVFAEAAFLFGFVVPGETAALVGGALAALHDVNLVVMLGVVIGGAIIGDSVGYEVGRIFGPWLLSHRPLTGRPGVIRARDLVARYGGPAVFLGRWIALARAVVPGVTGMSSVPYRVFLLYNAVGGLLWGTTFVMIGFAAGKSYERLASTFGTVALVVVGVLVMAAVVLGVIRHRRASGARAGRHRPPGGSAPASTPPA